MGIMPEDCQIQPQVHAVYCNNYNCMNRAKWSVGKGSGPKSLHLCLCDPCARNLFRSMQDVFGEAYDASTIIIKPERPDKDEYAEPEPPEFADNNINKRRIYVCEQCNEVFETPSAKGNHVKIMHKKEKGDK